MKLKSLVEEMGGVQRFTFEPLIPTSRKSMSKFLDITREEFSDIWITLIIWWRDRIYKRI